MVVLFLPVLLKSPDVVLVEGLLLDEPQRRQAAASSAILLDPRIQSDQI